jgi:hypothetical protein
LLTLPLLIVWGAALGCAPAKELEPSPALSETRAAQASFRHLEQRFFAEDEARRARLRPELEAFLTRYSRDPRAPHVSLLLAWVAVLEADWGEAERRIAAGRSSRSPRLRDFAELVDARRLLAMQQPEQALERLAPLEGRLVDAQERLSFAELRLQAALASRRYEIMLATLPAYLAAAPAEHGDRSRERARSALQTLPLGALEASLDDLDARARAGRLTAPEVWLRREARERLIRLAIERKDVELARRLLDTHPGLASRADLAPELLRLAGTAGSSGPVSGSFLGMAVEVGDPDAERRAASFARGLSAALAGPHDVPLVMKIVEDAHAVGSTLSELERSGALVLVAGASEHGAEQAATWVVSGRAPLLLIRDTPDLVLSELSFVLGTSDIDQLDALQKELVRRNLARAARVGIGGTSCRAPIAKAGTSRFPFQDWKRDQIQALLVFGSRSCVTELVTEARAQGFRAALALALDGADALPLVFRGSFALSAGDFPPAASPGELPVDFDEALGRDAGKLLRAALDPERAPGLRGRALAERLSLASAELETTTARGFAGKRRLPRALTIKEAP